MAEKTITASGLTFPEDEGTGLSNPEDSDFSSAGYFASLAAQSNSSNYVETGMSVTLDEANTEFDISDGLAFVLYDGGVDVQDSDGDYLNNWDKPVTFSVLTRQETNLSYFAGSVTHIYLKLNLTAANGVSFVVNDTGTAPAEPQLKIAEIDDT